MENVRELTLEEINVGEFGVLLADCPGATEPVNDF